MDIQTFNSIKYKTISIIIVVCTTHAIIRVILCIYIYIFIYLFLSVIALKSQLLGCI